MPFTTCTVNFTYFCFCLFLCKVMTLTLCLLDSSHTLAFSVFLISCMFSAADLGCKAPYWTLDMCANSWCFWTSCCSFLWKDNPYRFSFFFKSQSESRFCTVWVSSFLLCAELLRFFSWLDKLLSKCSWMRLSEMLTCTNGTSHYRVRFQGRQKGDTGQLAPKEPGVIFPTKRVSLVSAVMLGLV